MQLSSIYATLEWGSLPQGDTLKTNEAFFAFVRHLGYPVSAAHGDIAGAFGKERLTIIENAAEVADFSSLLFGIVTNRTVFFVGLKELHRHVTLRPPSPPPAHTCLKNTIISPMHRLPAN
jgi:hypothetical protein